MKTLVLTKWEGKVEAENGQEILAVFQARRPQGVKLGCQCERNGRGCPKRLFPVFCKAIYNAPKRNKG